MSFEIVVPGQPPSRNHAYKIVRIKHRDGGSHQQLAKIPGIEQYQLVASTLARQAKPEGWIPAKQIRIRYRFHLGRDIDCDNAMKSLNDALAIGLGVDDKQFLPCVEEKITKVRDPFVLIEVD